MKVNINVFRHSLDDDYRPDIRWLDSQTIYGVTKEDLLDKIYQTCLDVHLSNLKNSNHSKESIEEVCPKHITDFSYTKCSAEHTSLVIGDIILEHEPVPNSTIGLDQLRIEKCKILEQKHEQQKLKEEKTRLAELEMFRLLREKYGDEEQ